MKAIADKHPEAHIPVKSTLWDEIMDILVKIEQEPSIIDGRTLLEDFILALGDDRVPALGQAFSNQMKFDDLVTYDYKTPGNIDASFNRTTQTPEPPKTPVDRSKPDSGLNRSTFQRFAQLVADTHNVTICNSDQAILHARGTLLGNVDLPLPLIGKTIHECTFTKIDDIAVFFLDSLVHKANLYVRYNDGRDGLLGFISPATVGIFEQSSGIHGFWASGDPYSTGMSDSGNRTFLPTPRFLSRLQFFDHDHDTVNPITKTFITDLFGPKVGDGHARPHSPTALCPERIIDDPCTPATGPGNGCTGEPGTQNGAKIKLRDVDHCEGNLLDQRDDNVLFLTEYFGFADNIKPLLVPMTKRNREDIFIELMETLSRHWQTDKGTPNECSGDPKSKGYCARDGASTYEPILVDQFVTDFLPMLHDTVATLGATTINRCKTVDPNTHQCTATEAVNGIRVLLDGARALLDPNVAKARKLTNRDGSVQGLRNDGGKNPQVTPAYLMLQALSKFDASFADWSAKHPDDDRLVLWRRARSQLVDQFLTVNGAAANSTFKNPVTPPLLPRLLQLFREQLLAHCPDTFVSGGTGTCAWARQELTQKLGDVTSGPLFGSALDVTEAVRQDSAGRSELAKLLLYMTDPKSVNNARATMLTTLVDFPQLLADDSLAPLIRTLSEGAGASLFDPDGNVVRTGIVDAVTALLARLNGRAIGGDGVENCGRELDPNQVLTVALQNLVKPMPSKDGKTPQTPLEVIIDVISEVNRVNPGDDSKLQAPDYGTMTQNVSEFLLDKERGLEQFYEIVRQGTVGLPN